ncbi:MAG: chorismate-binding protein [Solirubrobacteraceae bacterium]
MPCSAFREARLVVEPLELSWSAAEGALALRGDPHPFVLTGSWSGGGALLGSEPVQVAQIDEDPFALLDRQPDVRIDDAPACAVGGGWFGMLGFGLCHALERLPPPPPARNPLPAFALAFYDHLLRLDADGQWWFEALWTEERGPALAARRRALLARRPQARPYRAGPFSPTSPGSAGLREAIAECKQRIGAGDLFQANLTFRLDGPFAGDPLDGYAAAIDALEPRYGAYLAGPWGATIGLSPELFLRRRGRDVLTRPIKGTVKRDAQTPVSARSALLASEKDRAEHVMIVDLMRNDLGRVCEYGSVRAQPQPVVEAHPGVWHLVTDVRGRLRDDVGHAQLLRATFPPGSVTGAPKIQALRVISELEGTARGAYTGAMGFASPVAGLELNVVIRTVEVRNGLASLGVGGGIVAASDPTAELEEAFAKARPLICGLGATLRRDTTEHGAMPSLVRALDEKLARPDPALGVMETVAVKDGQATHLQAHLRRLQRSLTALYDAPLPASLATDVQETARRASGHARLRIDAVPRRDGDIEIQLSLAEVASNNGAPVPLVPILLPGGLGAHKWCDRRLLTGLQEHHEAMPLLIDSDGAVLEAASANVWVLEGETLITPPADGRLLPGVTRTRLLALGGAQEAEITLDRLKAADAVLLSSSIAGVRVVRGRLPNLAATQRLRHALAGARHHGA